MQAPFWLPHGLKLLEQSSKTFATISSILSAATPFYLASALKTQKIITYRINKASRSIFIKGEPLETRIAHCKSGYDFEDESNKSKSKRKSRGKD